jgi:alpha-beta hydrolase superfamily lysophospholipase
MNSTNFTLDRQDGAAVYCYAWVPDSVRGIVQIVHGGAEHAGRYARLAEALTARDFAVYAEDHRGHGRTAPDASSLGDMGPANGLDRVCYDVLALSQHAREAHPGVPLVILGHSIGSLITQRVLIANGGDYDGAVLSGSPSIGVLLDADDAVDELVNTLGRDAPGDELQMQMFASFLETLGDIRTPFDWLSRDEAEVDKYIDDALCGFALRIGAWRDIIDAARLTVNDEAVANVPNDLPIYVFSGDADPVHNGGEAIDSLCDRYAKAGVSRLQRRMYKGGRHEMFNETNRDEVTADLLCWLDSVVNE